MHQSHTTPLSSGCTFKFTETKESGSHIAFWLQAFFFFASHRGIFRVDHLQLCTLHILNLINTLSSVYIAAYAPLLQRLVGMCSMTSLSLFTPCVSHSCLSHFESNLLSLYLMFEPMNLKGPDARLSILERQEPVLLVSCIVLCHAIDLVYRSRIQPR